MSIKEKILTALGIFHQVLKEETLQTLEEVEANTENGHLVGAEVVKELNNNLAFPDGTKFYPDIKDGKYGFNSDPARGADTFIPFKTEKTSPCMGDITGYGNTILSGGYRDGVDVSKVNYIFCSGFGSTNESFFSVNGTTYDGSSNYGRCINNDFVGVTVLNPEWITYWKGQYSSSGVWYVYDISDIDVIRVSVISGQGIRYYTDLPDCELIPYTGPKLKV